MMRHIATLALTIVIAVYLLVEQPLKGRTNNFLLRRRNVLSRNLESLASSILEKNEKDL